jgi:hypothetical protein
MSGSSQIIIKRGAALSLAMAFTNADGSAIDLTTVTLTAQVRDPQDDLVETLPLVNSSIQGTATCVVADTTQWPLGLLRCDIRVVQDGVPTFSETFGILVVRQVTQ